MSRIWTKVIVLIALTFYVSGAALFVHMHVDHDHHPLVIKQTSSSSHHPVNNSHHSHHDECPFCQSLAVMKAITLEIPVCVEFYQEIRETVSIDNSVFIINGLVTIPFSRPPPDSFLYA
jgi:disulfide bond formation protein DsbB